MQVEINEEIKNYTAVDRIVEIIYKSQEDVILLKPHCIGESKNLVFITSSVTIL